MLVAVVVILCIALAAVIAKWLLLRRQVRQMAEDIRHLPPGEGNRRLRVNTQDREMVELANAVNRLYEDVDRVRALQMHTGEELRQNMADISHDLRTPLTAITGYLRLLARADNTPDQRDEYLSIATRKTEALGKMVNSLFELARLETGAYSYNMEVLDAADVLAQEMAAGYASFAAAGKEPDVHLPSGALPIWADRQALQRIFSNMLQNILQHGGDSVQICAVEKQGRAILAFSNEAPNLTQESVAQIFKRSYTGDAVRNNKNTGLGLAIAYQFVQQMGGEIAANLDEGRLSITLSWPLASPSLAPPLG